MDFYKHYSMLLGLLALVLVIILLLTTPAFMFSSGVGFIDTKLHHSSGDEVYVMTKMDFSSEEHMNAFPMEIEHWQGFGYDTTEIKDNLGVDLAILRGYTRPGIYQPIFFLIMQAQTDSSFHPPSICYPSQGYEIEELGEEKVLVADISGTETFLSTMIPLAKLVVFKESDGEVTDRRVVLYYYLKGNPFTSDTVTMIQVEALAPIDGSYEGILKVAKDFISLTFPYMFEPSEKGEWNPLVLQLTESGIGGYLAIALLLFIPLAIMIYPMTRRAQGSTKKSGPRK